MADAAAAFTLWALQPPHGLVVGLVVYALALVVVCFGWLYLWFMQGARTLAALWVWRQAWRWWRARGRAPTGHRGVPGGREHSAEYRRFMQSLAWRRQRARVLRRDHHHCTACGGRRGLHAHHTFYASPIASTPDWGIETLCAGCHRDAHGR